MDEKVKNFSSGMVSRPGFAIATAGDAKKVCKAYQAQAAFPGE